MSGHAFPIVTASDLAAVRQFYVQLGFTETYRFPPDGPPQFLTMQRGDAVIGVGAGDAPVEDRVSYWVYVDDVDRAARRLEREGATVVAEPADQPWGERVAQLRDPAGVLVHLGAPITG